MVRHDFGVEGVVVMGVGCGGKPRYAKGVNIVVVIPYQ